MSTISRLTGTGGVHAHRRIVFQGLGSLGVAAALAGCAGGDDGSDGSGGDAGGASDVDQGTELATTAEVPVGGGLVLSDDKIVITQPTEGEFKAFTAVCTHQGCLVSEVAGGEIKCTCHGSSFSDATGDVAQGPAATGLAEVAIEVDGDRILTA